MPRPRPIPPTLPAKRQRLEALHQQAVVTWLHARGVWFFHCPSGAPLARGKVGGAMLKRLGVVAGVPDIIIPQPCRNRGCPVAFEMKAPGSRARVSREQKAWFLALQRFGWHTAVFDSADAAMRELLELGY